MSNCCRGALPQDVSDQFLLAFDHHCQQHVIGSQLGESAHHLAADLLDIPWVATFLPPSPESREMLSKLLEGYTLAVHGRSGWKLAVDARF